MFIYLFDGFLRRVFSLLRADGILYVHNALTWKHRSFYLSKILSAFFTRSLGPIFASSVHGDISLQNSSSPGVWHETPFTATSVPKLIFFYPISADGAKVPLPFLGFWPIISLLSTSLSGDCFGLLYVQYILSLSTRSQSAKICWLSLWPTIFTFPDRPAEVDLHYYSSLNGHSLAAW